MLNKSGIYKITNIINNKCYIGSAVNIKQRWADHKKLLNKNKHHSKYLQHAWNKYGVNNFKFEVLLTCEKEELIVKEQKQLDWFKPEYNIAKIAGSTLGLTPTKETKAKISESLKGKKHNEETLKKMSKVAKGKKKPPFTAEHRAKMSEAKKGKKRSPFTDEHRAKLSEANKGKPSSRKGKKASEETCQKLSEARRQYWANKRASLL